MRRQTPQGLAARWAARPLDVDPFHLPARFALPLCGDAGGPGTGEDTVLIAPDRIAVERCAEGPAEVPVARFAGVAVRIDRLGEGAQAFAISVNLHHDDPDFCIPVHMAYDMCDVPARWQSWGRALGLPLLVPGNDGEWRRPDFAPDRLIVREACARPARLMLKKRRSLFSAVRETGRFDRLDIVSGTEIIARS